MRGKPNAEKIRELMRELGRAARSPGQIYFTGGVTAVLLGWREMTLDVNLKADPEPSGFFEALPQLKDRIDVNIELACPDDFVPALPGWRERSIFIESQGQVTFFHYDLYGQALSKIERLYKRDKMDVCRMIEDKLVDPNKLWELFCAVESQLIRYPAVEADALRAQIKTLMEEGRL
jgi:hypothetical protein